MDGAVYVGNRDGVFYAVSAATGKELWKLDTHEVIVQTAAGADGRIVFVNEAMKAFCLEAATGKEVWTAQLTGGGCRDYWPVIHKGKVVIYVLQPGHRTMVGHLQPLAKRLPKARTVDDIIAEQAHFVEFFTANPAIRTVFVLNLADGKQPYVPSAMIVCRNTGPCAPPTVAGDGRMYACFRSSAGQNGIIDITRCGLGHLDIETGRFDKPLLCGGKGVGEVVGARSPFELTSDEHVTLSSGGKIVFGFRGDAGGGGIHVETKARFSLPRVKVPFSDDLQRSGNVLAISGKYVAYVKYHHLICVKGN